MLVWAARSRKVAQWELERLYGSAESISGGRKQVLSALRLEKAREAGYAGCFAARHCASVALGSAGGCPGVLRILELRAIGAGR